MIIIDMYYKPLYQMQKASLKQAISKNTNNSVSNNSFHLKHILKIFSLTTLGISRWRLWNMAEMWGAPVGCGREGLC